MTGGLAIGLLSVWQGTGHKLPPGVYWFVAIIALFAAFFRAWKAEREAKKCAISQHLLTQTVSSQTAPAWLALYNEKKRLEEELEAELESLEASHPILINGMQPDEPNAFYWSDSEETEYQKKSRKVDRIREELGMIKEKLKVAPQIHLDKP